MRDSPTIISFEMSHKPSNHEPANSEAYDDGYELGWATAELLHRQIHARKPHFEPLGPSLGA